MKYSLNKRQKNNLIRIIASMVMVAAIFFIRIKWLYLIPYVLVGYDILRKAFKGIINRQVFDENFLMAVATIGAMCLGDMLEAVAVMLFYQIGELFQSVAVGRSRRNIQELIDIMPESANLLLDGKIEKVDPDDVSVDSTIVIYPGEKVPIDGVIIEGQTTMDTSALTGESMPRDVLCGDTVLSGCINLSQVIKVRTTKEADESTAAKIMELVESSALRKAKAENFITRFARIYTPIVCYMALALAIVPSLITGQWGVWVIRALTFLVISCPCALVISIPLSFFGGIGAASKKGILVKGASYLENLSKIKSIMLDKTGTLTTGEFKVTGDMEILEMAAYAESGSNHPIAKSIRQAYGKELDLSRIKGIEEFPGKGVKANLDGREIYVGNLSFMKDLNISAEGQGIFVAGEKLLGVITIEDQLKDTSRKAIDALKAKGIKKITMLTGDSADKAQKVAADLGIQCFSQLMPEDKVRILEEEDEPCAFVGDGINDAPVLARADIGIAMGALGQDAAIEACDIVLMDDDPLKIADAIEISKKTLKIVKENIVFALAVKLACLILGALGIAGMWAAIFADVGVMILAVLNATRTMR